MIRGLMTDNEWAIVAPFLIIPSLRGGRPPANHRRVLDGVFWINRTGAPWRDLPEAFGNWNSIWRPVPPLVSVWRMGCAVAGDGR